MDDPRKREDICDALVALLLATENDNGMLMRALTDLLEMVVDAGISADQLCANVRVLAAWCREMNTNMQPATDQWAAVPGDGSSRHAGAN